MGTSHNPLTFLISCTNVCLSNISFEANKRSTSSRSSMNRLTLLQLQQHVQGRCPIYMHYYTKKCISILYTALATLSYLIYFRHLWEKKSRGRICSCMMKNNLKSSWDKHPPSDLVAEATTGDNLYVMVMPWTQLFAMQHLPRSALSPSTGTPSSVTAEEAEP